VRKENVMMTMTMMGIMLANNVHTNNPLPLSRNNDSSDDADQDTDEDCKPRAV